MVLVDAAIVVDEEKLDVAGKVDKGERGTVDISTDVREVQVVNGLVEDHAA